MSGLMDYRDEEAFARARDREMRRLLADPKLSDRRDSYLMDYGPDWPPASEPAEPTREPMTLAQRCGIWAIFVVILWAFGALVLYAIDPQPRGPVPVVDWQDAPGQGADVTTTLPPTIPRGDH